MVWRWASTNWLPEPMMTQFADAYVYMHHTVSLTSLSGKNNNISSLFPDVMCKIICEEWEFLASTGWWLCSYPMFMSFTLKSSSSRVCRVNQRCEWSCVYMGSAIVVFQGHVLYSWLLANSGQAFLWKLHCHWLKRLLCHIHGLAQDCGNSIANTLEVTPVRWQWSYHSLALSYCCHFSKTWPCLVPPSSIRVSDEPYFVAWCLTHWGLNQMADVLQTTFWNAFFLKKHSIFCFKFH